MARKEIIIQDHSVNIENIKRHQRFTCEEKNKYNTEESAKQVANKRFLKEGIKLSRYFCYNCSFWHLTKEVNRRMHLLNNNGYWTNMKRIIDYNKNEYLFYTYDKNEIDMYKIVEEGILLAHRKQNYPFMCALPEKREYRFNRQIEKPIVKRFNANKELIPMLQKKLVEAIDINNKIDFDEIQAMGFNCSDTGEIPVNNFNPVLKEKIKLIPTIKIEEETMTKTYTDVNGVKHNILYTDRGTPYFTVFVKCIKCKQVSPIDKRVPTSEGKSPATEHIMPNKKLNNLTKPTPNSREWIHKNCLTDQKKLSGVAFDQAKKELEDRLNSVMKKEEIIIKNDPIVMPIEQEEIKKETIVVNTTVYKYELPFEEESFQDLIDHVDPKSNTSDAIARGMAWMFIKELFEKYKKIPKEDIIQV